MEGGITLPPWAMVVLGVGLPVLTLLGKSAMTFLKANRHEDRQDQEQIFKQQASMIAAMQVRHDHLSRIVEDNSIRSVKNAEEVYKAAARHQEELEDVRIKQAACEEKHQECEEKYESLQVRVKELEETVKK